jgi:hypothetical protein
MALIAAGAALLAGCAAQNGPASSSVAPPIPIKVSPSRPAATSPQQTARADVFARLKAFVAPPGARWLASAPAGSADLFTAPTAGSNNVAATGWWAYPGTPKQAVAWFLSHVPRGSVDVGSGSGGNGSAGGGVQVNWVFYDQATIGLLQSRQLEIQVAVHGGRTLLQVDALDTWRPARPVSAVVPSGVTRIVLIAHPGSGVPRPATSGASSAPWTQVTVTDPGQVAGVVALVNALPTALVGSFACPVDVGAELIVDFYRGSGGADAVSPVAVAVDRMGGCGGTVLSVRGGPQNVALASSGQATLNVVKLTFPGLGH